jgi:anti-anti-sigma regulatory factor
MTYTTISNNFSVTNLNNVQLINMPSEFTASEANELKQLLHQFLGTFEQLSVTSTDQRSPAGTFVLRRCTGDLSIKRIVVNFEKTIFINNEGLIGICQILKFAKDTKIDLRFLSFSPQIKMVLSLVGLEQLFAIESSVSPDFAACLS